MTHKKSLRETLPEATQKWFEGGITFFIFKLLIAIIVYTFVIEPLLFKYFISEINYAFLDKTPLLFDALLIVAAIYFGLIYGKSKKFTVTFFDSILVFIVIYSSYLGTFKYELHPVNSASWDKFIYFVGLLPVVSIGFNLFKKSPFLVESVSEIWSIIVKSASETWPTDSNNSNVVANATPSFAVKLNTDVTLIDLESDSENGFKDADILGYYELSQVIMDAIKSLNPIKAFSIGINGAWGSGKSSLIDILKSNLIPKYNEEKGIEREIRVIPFSPWLYPDQESLIANFFSQWREEMDDPSLKMLFDDYSSLLNDIKVGGMIIKLQNLFNDSKSLEELKGKIEAHLRTQKKFTYIVIVDDLDRLEKTEILEIAKLSRVLADFPNTFYLLAYDREYIDSVLKDKNDVRDKRHTYFDKIIQLEFKVPQVTEDKLSSYVSKLILMNKEFIIQSDDTLSEEKISEQLSTIQALLLYQYFIPTIRDVKRFINGFLLRYNSLRKGKHKVTFKEIFLLEILFYKHKDFYEEFYLKRKKNAEEHNLANGSTSNIEPFSNNDNTRQQEKIQSILKEIFIDRNSVNRQLQLIDSYYSYFSTNGFTNADLNRFMSGGSQKAKIALAIFADGFAFNLILGYLKKSIAEAMPEQTNSFEKLANGELERNLELFTRALKDSNIYLDLTGQQEINNYLTKLWLDLDEHLRGKDSLETDRIQKCRSLIREFSVPCEIYNTSNDQPKVLFKKQETPDIKSLPGMDDSIYEKILDFESTTYELSLMPPKKEHWRFGVVLSKTENFPISYGFRTYYNHPLFHIGKHHPNANPSLNDMDNIIITFYKDSNDSIETPKTKSVKFFAEKEIRMVISYKNRKTIFELFHGDDSIQIIDDLPIQDFSKCRMQAWADNDKANVIKDYEFEVRVRELKPNGVNAIMADAVIV